jgi:DNA-binding NtrC family response regulator
MANKALIIDDDKVTLELLTFQLSAEGFDVTTSETGAKGLEHAKSSEYDVILTDLNLPDINGIEMVRQSKMISPETEIIMITGYDRAEKAIEATRVGAFGYRVKPLNFDDLMVDIRNAVESKRQAEINRKQAQEIKELRSRLSSRQSYEGIIGGSRAMQNIYEIIENVAESDANILILGESGVGKEVIANAIHYKSHRSKLPFVKVNCSALPKDLIESQLFGHVKGSFTGAHADKTGFIGQANGGSLLLDEIGEMPVDLQPKLLRVLQEKVYYRVGSDKPQDADFRLISATNRNPFDAIKDGQLREDLYYRINTIEIRIPPLRDRMEDIPMLAEHFLNIYSEKYSRPDVSFAQSAYDQMLHYHWRGNVRELQNVVERAVLLSKTGKIEALDIAGSEGSIYISEGIGQSEAAAANGGGSEHRVYTPGMSSAAALPIDLKGEKLFESVGKMIVDNLSEPEDGKENTDVFNSLESGVVQAALERTRGNKQAAANLLGVYRPRLYGMIKRHSLDPKA